MSRKLLLAAAVLIIIVTAGRMLGGLVPSIAEKIAGAGPAAPIAFIAVYSLATVAFIPGSLLTLAAGALFGLAQGTAWVFIGATLGASGAFMISRSSLRGMIEKRLVGFSSLTNFDEALKANGLKIVLLLRLSPLLPFNALNYALGMTKVRYSDYLLASIGMLPGTILYVYYGRVAGDVAALASGRSTPHDTGYYLVLGLGLAATLAVSFLIAKVAKNALKSTASSTNDQPVARIRKGLG